LKDISIQVFEPQLDSTIRNKHPDSNRARVICVSN